MAQSGLGRYLADCSPVVDNSLWALCPWSCCNTHTHQNTEATHAYSDTRAGDRTFTPGDASTHGGERSADHCSHTAYRHAGARPYITSL